VRGKGRRIGTAEIVRSRCAATELRLRVGRKREIAVWCRPRRNPSQAISQCTPNVRPFDASIFTISSSINLDT